MPDAMCIYYPTRTDLHFDSQEHIIPAAIGGIQKLPNNYVSREFNNDISRIERELIQQSLVAIPREIEGPGKRGKLADKHQKKSDVFVLSNAADESKFALGYIQKGTGYEIDQVVYDTSTGAGQAKVQAIERLKTFKEDCKAVNINRLRTILDDRLAKTMVLFGIQPGIEDRYDFFFAKHSANSLVLTADIIRQFGEGINENQTGQRSSYQPVFERKIVFDLNHLRVIGKIAFNYLAFKTGNAFVSRELFDPVRSWIASGGENRFAGFNKIESSPFTKVGVTLPDGAHYIYLTKVENSLIAKVALYGLMVFDVILCDAFDEPFHPECFICDWKARREYELLEYLQAFHTKTI